MRATSLYIMLTSVTCCTTHQDNIKDLMKGGKLSPSNKKIFKLIKGAATRTTGRVRAGQIKDIPARTKPIHQPTSNRPAIVIVGVQVRFLLYVWHASTVVRFVNNMLGKIYLKKKGGIFFEINFTQQHIIDERLRACTCMPKEQKAYLKADRERWPI